ncbi:MAG: hypothetical protein IJC69_04845, partial [Clostridia bacterium]|nr:hypothetical protein [Clostridia bacterium]
GYSVAVEQFENYAFRTLIQEKFIHRSSTYGDPYVYLSDAGKAYVESLLASKADKKTEKFRFWLPLIVSNLISVTALIVAILAYIKQ